jgi:hypothetical protein
MSSGQRRRTMCALLVAIVVLSELWFREEYWRCNAEVF